MSEQQSEHLSNAQIEDYGDRTSGAKPDQNQRSKDQRIEAHLDDCPSCRARVLDFQRTRLAPQADPQVKQSSTPECPSENDLRQLAAGLCSDDVAATLTYHAATCDHCGPLLRTYTEDFSDDFSPEEQTALASLQSSSASWQKKTARQMLEAAAGTSAGASARAASATPAADVSPSGTATTAKPDKKSSAILGRKAFFWKWTLIPATAAATVAAVVVICGVVGLGVWYARRDTPEKVEKLLAQAYTEQRTMEMRWPEAEWGPVRVTRGAEESHLSRPSSLLKAEKVIARRQVGGSSGTDWLTVKAEAELLNHEPQAAIDDLTQALNADPASTRAKLLLAIAYGYQGNLKESTESREKALHSLNEVLETEPTNPTALFNRALLYSQLNLPDRAIADWNTLLSVEKNSTWFHEAHEKFGELQRRRNGSDPM